MGAGLRRGGFGGPLMSCRGELIAEGFDNKTECEISKYLEEKNFKGL